VRRNPPTFARSARLFGTGSVRISGTSTSGIGQSPVPCHSGLVQTSKRYRLPTATAGVPEEHLAGGDEPGNARGARRSLALTSLIPPPAPFWSVVQAADTTIPFDDVPADTFLDTQFHDKGVDFGFPPYASLPSTSQVPSVVCCTPITRAAPSGH